MRSPLLSSRALLGLTSTAAVSAVAVALVLASTAPASAAGSSQAKEGLGVATSFAVLAGTKVDNVGSSTIVGDVGVSPGSAITGFPPATVTDGTIHVTDGPATTAQADSSIAYTDLAGRPATDETADPNLGGLTLAPGAYSSTADLSITGTLTLDAQNDPDAVFIFQTGAALNAATNSNVALINGANPCNVFWKVGSSATLNTGVQFAGTVIASASITTDTGASVTGRLLAGAAVTLGDSQITRPMCTQYPAGPVVAAGVPVVGGPGGGGPVVGGPGGGGPVAVPPSSSTPTSSVPSSGTSTGTTTGTPTGTPSSGGAGASHTPGSSTTGSPVATGLSSASGPAAGGTVIVVSGTGFQPGHTTVTVGGTTVPAGSVTVLSSTRLRFVTPAHRPGRVQLTFSTTHGRSNRLTYTFTTTTTSTRSTTTTSLTTTTTTAETGSPTARLIELAALLLVAGYALTTFGRKRVIGRHRH